MMIDNDGTRPEPIPLVGDSNEVRKELKADRERVHKTRHFASDPSEKATSSCVKADPGFLLKVRTAAFASATSAPKVTRTSIGAGRVERWRFRRMAGSVACMQKKPLRPA
jgi:hypothetical protein